MNEYVDLRFALGIIHTLQVRIMQDRNFPTADYRLGMLMLYHAEKYLLNRLSDATSAYTQG